MTRQTLLLAALFTSALCFTITEPSESKPWLQSAPDNRVVWTVEAGDPAIIDIRLVAKNQRKLNGALALGASVQASAGQLVVPYLESAAGAGYHVLFTSVTNDTDVLATSDVFAVTSSKKAATSVKDQPSGRSSGAVSMATSSGAADAASVSPAISNAAAVTMQPTPSPSAPTTAPTGSALSPPSQVPGSAASLASPFFAALFMTLGLALVI